MIKFPHYILNYTDSNTMWKVCVYVYIYICMYIMTGITLPLHCF